MSDRVSCMGLRLQVQIGFHAFERDILQTVNVDLELTTDFRRGPERDSHEGLVDYYLLTRHLERHVSSRRYDLIEALAVDLARESLRTTPAQAVKVKVTKSPLDMPSVSHVSVELTRTPKDFPELVR